MLWDKTVLLKTNGEGQCSHQDDVIHDTVGAVCVDDFGNVASAVSSGGIILKQPGRLGQVNLFSCLMSLVKLLPFPSSITAEWFAELWFCKNNFAACHLVAVTAVYIL